MPATAKSVLVEEKLKSDTPTFCIVPFSNWLNKPMPCNAEPS